MADYRWDRVLGPQGYGARPDDPTFTGVVHSGPSVNVLVDLQRDRDVLKLEVERLSLEVRRLQNQLDVLGEGGWMTLKKHIEDVKQANPKGDPS